MSVIILILVPLCVHDVPFFFLFLATFLISPSFCFQSFTHSMLGVVHVCVLCVFGVPIPSWLHVTVDPSLASYLLLDMYKPAGDRRHSLSWLSLLLFFFFFFLSLILNWALCPWYLDVWPSQCSCPFPVSFWAQYAFNPHYNSMCLL